MDALKRRPPTKAQKPEGALPAGDEKPYKDEMEREDLKVALVTGAGSGIGRASALALARDGFKVVLVGRGEEALAATAALGEADQFLPLVCDVTDEAAVEAAFAEVKTRFARLDLLFNNAGSGAMPAPLEQIPAAAWRRVLEVNVTGVFLCTQAAVRLMKSQTPRGGRIINNGSISAHAPRPFSAAYTASKHAVTGLTRQTALEGRDFDIACGQIDIGNAATAMTRRMAAGVPQADGSIRAEPVMDVAEAARAVAYMASLPLGANVLFMTVMATAMPYLGRG